MSALTDLKDKLSAGVQEAWGNFQESDTYNKLNDIYENLTPVQQKLVITGVAAVVSLIILSIPLGRLSEAGDRVVEFEGKRMTIRELLKAARDSANVPNIPTAPPMDSLQADFQNFIQQENLLPEQVISVASEATSSSLIPNQLSSGAIVVRLAKLNINQILDLGYKFQARSPSVKMKDLIMKANAQDARYYDATFKLIALAVPEAPTPPPAESNNRRRGR